MTYTVTLTRSDRLRPVYVHHGKSARDVLCLVTFALRDAGRSPRDHQGAPESGYTVEFPGGALRIEEEK